MDPAELTPGSSAWLAARLAMLGHARLEVNGFELDVEITAELAEACLDTLCFLQRMQVRQP